MNQIGNRLSVQQAKFTVLIAFLLGIASSFVQIYLDYRNSKANVSETIGQVMESVRRPATGAVLNLDMNVGREILNGVFEYPATRKAIIFDEKNNELVSLQRPFEPARTRWLTAFIFGESRSFSMLLDTRQLAGNDNDDLGNLFGSGRLDIFVDTYYSGSEFLDRAVLIIVSGLFRNLLLALCLLWFFHYYMTKPILRVQAALGTIAPSDPGRNRIEPPRLHEHDEMGTLVSAINQLLFSISSNILDRVHHAEKAARLSVELEEGAKRETEHRIYSERLEQANEELNTTLDELAQSNHSLEHALDDLRKTQDRLVESEKMAALGQLVGGVAHEINTPVGVGVTAASTIVSNMKDFRRGFQNGEVSASDLEKFLDHSIDGGEMVLRNLQRAAELTQSFKQVAVSQSGELKAPFALRAQLLQALKDLEQDLDRAAIKVEVYGLESHDIQWEGYAIAYRQVISNLLTNAITHAFEKNQKGTVRFELSFNDRDILLSYSDDGQGMAPDVRERAFDPFFTTNRTQGGTGLGLHLVYNIIVQKFGGSLSLDTKPGAGCHIKMSWPK